MPLAGRHLDLSPKSFLEFAERMQILVIAAETMISSMLTTTEPDIDLLTKRDEEFTHLRNQLLQELGDAGPKCVHVGNEQRIRLIRERGHTHNHEISFPVYVGELAMDTKHR